LVVAHFFGVRGRHDIIISRSSFAGEGVISRSV